MEFSTDLSKIQWLKNHIDWDSTPRPHKIYNFLPKYDYYVAVLWIPGIIDNFPFEQIVYPPNTIEEINKNVEIWNKFGIGIGQNELESNQNLYTKTTFKELADKFRLKHDRFINYKLDWHTEVVIILNEQTKVKLASIISALTRNERYFNLYVEDYYRFSYALPTEEESVFKVTIEEYLEFMEKTMFDSSSYLFPEDQSWYLMNLEDLSYSILAFDQRHKSTLKNLNLPDTFSLTADDTLYEE